MALGPDGNVWFTATTFDVTTTSFKGTIGRITPSGDISEYPIPTPRSGPAGITVGPDGNLWFTEQVGNNIGRINP